MTNFIRKISDVKNAFRVLEIMDKGGCNIKEVVSDGIPSSTYWKVTIPYYISKEEANDLQKIVQFKDNFYGNHRGIWKLFSEARNTLDGCRFWWWHN